RGPARRAARGSLRPRGHRGAHARHGAVAHATALDPTGASPGRQDGVCANVDFPSPRRLVEDAVATASGIEPDADAWRPERRVWPLLEVVDGALHEPWLKNLAVHLGATVDTADAARQSRRFASVRHIAELYDRYAVQ